MTMVEIQPVIHCGFGNARPPMMVLFVFTSMTITMIGPAQRPLKHAAQKKPLIGHVGEIQYKSQKRHRDDRSIEAQALSSFFARPRGQLAISASAVVYIA
jgi:hypothetical protein